MFAAPPPIQFAIYIWDLFGPERDGRLGKRNEVHLFDWRTQRARRVQTWAERLGVDRSELLRRAVRRYLLHLANGHDALTWIAQPRDECEQSLTTIPAGVSPTTKDWIDATR